MHDFDEGMAEQIVFAILKILKISTDSVEKIVNRNRNRNRNRNFSRTTKSKFVVSAVPPNPKGKNLSSKKPQLL